MNTHTTQRGRRTLTVLTALLAALTLALTGCGTTNPGTVKTIVKTVYKDEGRGGGAPSMWNNATTGGADAAIGWAQSFEAGAPNYGTSTGYSDYCLLFVANAYGAQWPGQDTAWDLAQASTLNDPNNPAAAPRGALMFFGPNSYNEYDGHVAISLGGGQMIGANVPDGNIKDVVENYPQPNVQSIPYWNNLYRGWAWPPASWGPLAQQAAQQGNSTPTNPNVNNSPSSGSNGGQLTVQPPNPNDGLQGSNSNPQPAGGSNIQSGANPQPATSNPQPAGSGSQAQNGSNGSSSSGSGGGAAPATVTEYPGGPVHTLSDPSDEGGPMGPVLPANQPTTVLCREQGAAVQDGNTWWYKFTDGYWGSADAFYNTPGMTSGSLHGTPFVDPAVPTC